MSNYDINMLLKQLKHDSEKTGGSFLSYSDLMSNEKTTRTQLINLVN